MRLRQEVQQHGGIVRVEPHRRRESTRAPRPARPAYISASPGRAVALSKVGIERDHVAKLRERAVVIAPPQQHVAERHVAHRLLIVQFERAARPSLRLVERLRRIGRPAADVVAKSRRAPSRHAARRNSGRSRSPGGASRGPARPTRGCRARAARARAARTRRPRRSSVPRRRSRCSSPCVSVTASTPTIFSTTSSWVAKMSVRSRSNRSAQRWPPLPASMSCAVMRTRLPALRMLPSSTKRTPRSRADLLHLDRPALVGERGIARDHEQAGDLRQIGDQVFGHAVAEIFLLGIAAHVREGQNGDRRLVGQSGRRCRRRRLRRCTIDPTRKARTGRRCS